VATGSAGGGGTDVVWQDEALRATLRTAVGWLRDPPDPGSGPRLIGFGQSSP